MDELETYIQHINRGIKRMLRWTEDRHLRLRLYRWFPTNVQAFIHNTDVSIINKQCQSSSFPRTDLLCPVCPYESHIQDSEIMMY